MEPVLEVPNVINVFSTTVLNGKKKGKRASLLLLLLLLLFISFIPRKEHRSKDLILKRKNTTTIKVLFLCEFVTDLASKTMPFL